MKRERTAVAIIILSVWIPFMIAAVVAYLASGDVGGLVTGLVIVPVMLLYIAGVVRFVTWFVGRGGDD